MSKEKIDIDICYTGRRVIIKPEWGDAGQCGTALGEPIFVDQEWLPVLWDGEEDPDFIKLRAIEVVQPGKWKDDFTKEFHKHYDNILTPELIEGSIQWHIKFLEKYIK